MGEGFAVEPTNAKVVAPIDGVIKSIFPTKHALTLTSNQGRDLLIHIGIDTVQLKESGFKCSLKKVNEYHPASHW